MAMAVAVRRALASRPLGFVSPRRSIFYCCSRGCFSSNIGGSVGVVLKETQLITQLEDGLRKEWQRGFAKGKKSKDDESTVQVVPDIGPAVKSTASTQMQSAVDALSRELNKLRTGRASAGMLDHIIVEAKGSRTPLSHIAAVSVLDPQMLCVTPYDLDVMKDVERAIVSSPLGLNPTPEGQRLTVPIPELTKEHIQAMSKLVAKASEDVKQSIRRARHNALDKIKKAGSSMAKDDAKKLEKEIEDLTKKFVKSAEDMCKAKEKEISGK